MKTSSFATDKDEINVLDIATKTTANLINTNLFQARGIVLDLRYGQVTSV